MNFRNKKNRYAHIEAGALSDILFFLLIFFLITSTLANPNVIRLNRPKSSIVGSTKSSLVITITKDLDYFINKTPTTQDNLPSDLEAALTQVQDPTILLNVDKDVPFEYVVNVMNIGNKLKAKIVVATEKEKAQ